MLEEAEHRIIDKLNILSIQLNLTAVRVATINRAKNIFPSITSTHSDRSRGSRSAIVKSLQIWSPYSTAFRAFVALLEYVFMYIYLWQSQQSKG